MKKLIVVLLVLFFFSQAFSQISSAGLHLGAAASEGKWEIGFAGSAFANMKVYYRGIFFQPNFTFVNSSYSTDLANGESVDLNKNNYGVGINFLRILSTYGKGKALFGGIGLGFNFIDSQKIDYPTPSSVGEVIDDTNTKVGFSFLTSYMHKFGELAASGEAKFTYMPGGFSYFQLGVGILYIF